MKTKINSIIFTLIIVTVCITSCNRQDELINDDTFSQFKLLNSNYLNSIRANMDLRINWKKILGADLKGAVQGGALGAAAGAAIGGVSAGFGAGLGALLFGAGASIEAAGSEANPKPIVIMPNSNNPFDNLGYHHYNCLNLALQNSNNYLNNGIFSTSLYYNFCKNYTVVNNVYNLNEFPYFTLANFELNFNYLKNNENKTILEFVLLLHDNGKISDSVFNYLYPYFQSYSSTTNIGDFVTYSISAENLVVNSNLSSIDKQLVLEMMSTARYGIQYWGIE